MERLVFDLETDGLITEVTKIHCCMIWNVETNTLVKYDQENNPIVDAVRRLRDADEIIGHNIIGYDIPVLQKLFPKWEPKGKVTDTYVWSACAYPDIKEIDFNLFRKGKIPASLIGSYSLEAWGHRLGLLKGNFAKQTDWKRWSPEMSTYCVRDVNVTTKLWENLQTTLTSPEQVKLESQVLKVLNRQQQHGVLFDVKKAEELYIELTTKREKLREQIQKEFPPFYRRVGQLFTPKRDNKKMGYTAGGTMQKIELTEFNPSSSIHIARMLMQKYNWKPDDFAEKEIPPMELQVHYDRLDIKALTTPKIDDEILDKLDYPEAKKLAEFQMLQKRCAMLSEGKQGWMRHYNPETNRIHGSINQFGAVTGRCIHFNPNLGQVTSARSPYGKQCRELFRVPEGYKLVGCDADGLEARCKAHYIQPYDGGEFIKCILEGKKEDGSDIHSLNRDRLGLSSRDTSKTWYYAFMYGSGNANLGRIAATDDNYKGYEDLAKLGLKLRKKLAKEFNGLQSLIDAVQKKAKLRHPKMWLKGLDGRRVPVRAVYSALNTLLQGAGAILTKKAMCIADDLIQAEGLVPRVDYCQVLYVHDEWQWEVKEEYADVVARCAEKSIVLAGEYFNFRCPLSGSSVIGDNWYDTH